MSKFALEAYATALRQEVVHCARGQRYEAVGHAFAKRKMRHDFFSCGGDPLELDADAIARALAPNADGEPPDRVLVRSAFMLCHIIPMVNAALESYKRDVCGIG